MTSGLKEQEISKIFSTFFCAKDEDLELFLKHRAILFENLLKARTFLLFDRDRLENGDYTILAYFTLSQKSVALPDSMSNRRRKEMDGFSGKWNGAPVSNITCYLIGQLAKNSNVDCSLDGNKLVEFAHTIVMAAVKAVGGRWEMVECRNVPALINFYENNNFQCFDSEPTSNMSMVQMIRKIEA